jgi:hypothetical protein
MPLTVPRDKQNKKRNSEPGEPDSGVFVVV